MYNFESIIEAYWTIMQDKSTEFTRVTTKTTGTIRNKNSLLVFTRDHPDLSCLQNYDVQLSSKGTREAIYIHPKVSYAADSTLTTFRGVAASNPHLSIDLKFSLESARDAKGFGPAHVTVSYGEFRLHVYFNQHGKRIDLQVRSDTDGTYAALTREEKEELLEQIAPLEALLKELILKKQGVYLELSRSLFELESLLSKAKTKVEYFKIRDEYLEQLKRFNSYSDTVEVRQPRCIQPGVLDVNVGSVASPAAAAEFEDAAEFQGVAAEAGTDETVMRKTEEVSSAASGHALDSLKATLSEVVNAVIAGYKQEAPLSMFIPMLIEIDELALLIGFESKKDKAFLSQKMRELPFKLSDLMGEFKEKLKAGDFDYIKMNYAAISGVINLIPIFLEFLSALPEQQSSPLLLKRQLEIADYLYENSEIYRSVFLMKNMSFSCDTETSIGYGFLIEFFKQKNVSGFKMLLEHGIPVDGIQMLSQPSYFLNALQVVTFLYAVNPDIRFIDLLLAHEAPMRMTQKITCTEAELLDNPRLKQPKLVPKRKSNKRESEVSKQALSGDMDVFQHEVQKAAEQHALEIAVKMKSDLLLIDRLAGATEPLQLLQVLTSLVTNLPFTTRVVVQREASELTMLLGFFIPPESATHSAAEKHMENIARILSEHVTPLFSDLDDKEKREIISTLDALAANSMQEKEPIKAHKSFRGAQLAYSFLNVKTPADHKEMYRRYLMLSQVVKESYPGMAKSEEENARVFLEQWRAFKESQGGGTDVF